MKIPKNLVILKGTFESKGGYEYYVGIDYYECAVYVLGRHGVAECSCYYIMFAIQDLSISREATSAMVDAYYSWDDMSHTFVGNNKDAAL